MNASIFQAIKSTISSLLDSTTLNISAGNITCRLDRRCSPYKTHQSVQYNQLDNSDFVHQGVFFQNDNRLMWIIKAGDTIPETKIDMIWNIIPAKIVEGLLLIGKKYMSNEMYAEQPLVCIGIKERKFLGYSVYGDGKPVFLDMIESGQHTLWLEDTGDRSNEQAYRIKDGFHIPVEWDEVIRLRQERDEQEMESEKSLSSYILDDDELLGIATLSKLGIK